VGNIVIKAHNKRLGTCQVSWLQVLVGEKLQVRERIIEHELTVVHHSIHKGHVATIKRTHSGLTTIVNEKRMDDDTLFAICCDDEVIRRVFWVFVVAKRSHEENGDSHLRDYVQYGLIGKVWHGVYLQVLFELLSS
jgi:hypothetical protein